MLRCLRRYDREMAYLCLRSGIMLAARADLDGYINEAHVRLVRYVLILILMTILSADMLVRTDPSCCKDVCSWF